MVIRQNEKLDKLEDLVYRMMHRGRVALGGNREGEDQESKTPTSPEATIPKSSETRTESHRHHRTIENDQSFLLSC